MKPSPFGTLSPDQGLANHPIEAARFVVDLGPFSRVAAIGASLFAVPAVAAAHPELQRGAPSI